MRQYAGLTPLVASIRGTDPSEEIMNFLALTFYDTRCLISASKRRPRSGFPRF